MRVLMAHNHYKDLSGENESFLAEAALLEDHGHQVVRYELHNDRVEGPLRSTVTGLSSVWNAHSYSDIASLCGEVNPDVVHFQNIFPLISPSAYYAAARSGVPVVQTVRNFRLSCLSGDLFRDGAPCEECLHRRLPWPGVAHRCYRNSRPASMAVASMLVAHRWARSWERLVDVWISLTRFTRDKLRLPVAETIIKPVCIYPAPDIGQGEGCYALYVGRLTEAKGIRTLLQAWRDLGTRIPLRIVGDGPLAAEVRAAAAEYAGVEWLGRLPLREVYEQLRDASFAVFPSQWYETFGRVAVEAFCTGTPVVASNIGAVAEVCDVPDAAMLFQPGDVDDLKRVVSCLLDAPDKLPARRQAARNEFEARYTGEKNVQLLLKAYNLALTSR